MDEIDPTGIGGKVSTVPMTAAFPSIVAHTKVGHAS